MTITRRNMIKTACALPLSSIVTVAASTVMAAPSLPDKSSFEAMGISYLNNASQHPISFKSSEAVEKYLAKRRLHPAAPTTLHDSKLPLESFAKLINADFDEVAYVQSTTAGEQMIIRGLGFPHVGGHIITDEMHFPGSRATYDGLARTGMDVTRIKEHQGQINFEDIQKALRPDTKLIAISLISMETGFKHDLKAICDIAHANGTLVYADIIQAAGAIPVDVKDSGVDFAACSSYKWLMGDFGVGFVYASKAAQSRLTRTNFGYFGLNIARTDQGTQEAAQNNGFPLSASGHFAIGTRSFTGVAILSQSLDYILKLGVDNIHAHSQKMINRLKDEIPALGIKLKTPLDSDGPMVVGAMMDADKILNPHLKTANVKISTYPDHFRISPSVFNNMDDIDRVMAAIKAAL